MKQAIVRTGLALALALPLVARASTLVPEQVALPGRCIPRWTLALPRFGPDAAAAAPRVDVAHHPFLQITMKEIAQQVLPAYAAVAGCPSPAEVSIQPTRVWAYETRDLLSRSLLGPAHWPAVTLENRRFLPTLVKYVNELPAFNPAFPDGPGLVQGLVSVDQTVDWAAPSLSCLDSTDPRCRQPFTGPPPAVAHLHGGEVPSAFDGGPDQWFTPTGQRGNGYRSALPTDRNAALYLYPNAQEPGTPWFHDHALGATRTNVYSGLAGFYFIRDPLSEPRNLPAGPFEIELAIQDRQFDTRSQLFFPDGSGPNPDATNLNGTPPNPDVHPFWNPEFVGDVVVVNGAPWPVLTVEPRRYRLRIVAGANARMWNLDFSPAKAWVIGADDAYLAKPALVAPRTVNLAVFDEGAGADVPFPFVQKLFLAPGERGDVVVDFAGLGGTELFVTNDAPVPFPGGLAPGDVTQEQMDRVLKIVVKPSASSRDTSCNPATGGCARPLLLPFAKLTDFHGHTAPGVKLDRRRQLILVEVGGPGGPLEVLVNNSKFDGRRSPGVAAEFADGVSEVPRVGATELWEVLNLTMDAHPMHTHLAQFQVLDRQPFDWQAYSDAYAAAFPGLTVDGNVVCPAGEFCPGYGPPRPYLAPNADGAVGGNPALSPFLTRGPARSPGPEEQGWKDTAKAHHGEVLRMLVRYAPTAAPVWAAAPGRNLYPFDPTAGPGYVWHCHIVDHEDNEMMRPVRIAR